MSLRPNWDRNKVEPAQRTTLLGCGNDRSGCPWTMTCKPLALIGHAFPLTPTSFGARRARRNGGLPLTRDRNELDEPPLSSSRLFDWSGTRAQICF